MKKFLSKYVEIYTVVSVVIALIIFILKDKTSKSRKMSAILLLISCVHCWEESKWAGGYFDLILNNFKLKGKVDDDLAYTVLTDLALLATTTSCLIDKKPFSLLSSGMGLFEFASHTLGIKMYNMEKPYVPGMWTSWIWAAASVYNLGEQLIKKN